ncbi:MAG: serine/threonine-protein phosphatase [Desulfobulbaceae bacterium]|nr:serine/threonine-protein phosphatase [Desulfobulbaceae bacterium]
MKPHKTKIEIAARSATGNVRKENQDRMSGMATPLGQLYILADGMGGHKGGALAAEMTVHGLQNYIATTKDSAPVDKIIGDAFKNTNKTVYEQAHSGDVTTEGMGSTAVLVLIHGDIASVAHVGDSRAYLFRNNRLQQLTTDHTVVQRMVEAGMLQPEDAAHHPDSNIIERAIGNKPEVAVDIQDEFTLLDGDAILLCSDGLSGYASNEEIEFALQHSTAIQEIPDKLIRFALEDKGSTDNITVQFIQYGARRILPTGQKNDVKANAAVSKKVLSLLTLIISLILVAGIATGVIFYFMEKKHSDKTIENISAIDKQKSAVEKDIPAADDTKQVSDTGSAMLPDKQRAEQDSSPVPAETDAPDSAAQ